MKALVLSLALLAAIPVLSAQVVLLDTAVFDSSSTDNKESSDSTYFNAAGGLGTTFSAVTSTFNTGTAGSNRLLLAAVAWRNAEFSSITFGGVSLYEIPNTRVENIDSLSLSTAVFALGETGIAVAADNDFTFNLVDDQNTSLGFQAFMLENADEGSLFAVSQFSAALQDLSIDAGTVGSGGFGLTTTTHRGRSRSDPGDIQSPWTRLLNDQSYNGHTGGQMNSAIVENFAGGSLVADWTGGGEAEDNGGGSVVYVTAIPEPGAGALLVLSLLGLNFLRRRR